MRGQVTSKNNALYVKGLWRYPEKSLAGEALETAELTAAGIPGDRALTAATSAFACSPVGGTCRFEVSGHGAATLDANSTSARGNLRGPVSVDQESPDPPGHDPAARSPFPDSRGGRATGATFPVRGDRAKRRRDGGLVSMFAAPLCFALPDCTGSAASVLLSLPTPG